MKEIKAKFISGYTCVYSYTVFEDLKSDPEIIQIYDNSTGEVIYTNDLYKKFMNDYFQAFRNLNKGV